MKDVISPDTALDLAQTTRMYAERLTCPFIAEVGAFAAAFSGVSAEDVRTLITTSPDFADGLAISVEGGSNTFTNVDLPLEGPAIIVKPGFYDEEGNPNSAYGEFRRLPIRPLTEAEGRGLIADMLGVISVAPADRLR